MTNCRICKGSHDGEVLNAQMINGWVAYVCEVCGQYGLTEEAMEWLDVNNRRPDFTLRMAALSHLIVNTPPTPQQRYFFIRGEFLEREYSNFVLPTPPTQLLNFVRLVGNTQRETGEGYIETGSTAARVGTFNWNQFQRLTEQTRTQALISASRPVFGVLTKGLSAPVVTYELSMEGWDLFENELRGQVAGTYGFLAMQFHDEALDGFLAKVKPGIEEKTGFALKDVIQMARAGVIDNIIREQIRDAAFVVVDLSHGNRGAYWEAGYAEGLGKPVIYMCEKVVFDDPERKPHFDTNHCTTVPWSHGGEDDFVATMSATIAESLSYLQRVRR